MNCDTKNKWERYALHHGLGSFLQARRETLRRVAGAGLHQKTVSVQVAQLGLHFLTPRDESETKTRAGGGWGRLLNGPWKRRDSQWLVLASRGQMRTHCLFNLGPLAKAWFLNCFHTWSNWTDWRSCDSNGERRSCNIMDQVFFNYMMTFYWFANNLNIQLKLTKTNPSIPFSKRH